MWKCRLLTVYYTVRYGFLHSLKTGHLLLGHHFIYTDEVQQDYWVMECTRCGTRAGIDQGPPRKK